MEEGRVLCCKCGVSHRFPSRAKRDFTRRIHPNAGNMCAKCFRSEVEEWFPRRIVRIFHCPECDRYLPPPSTWIEAQLESKELLNFCLERLENLNKDRVVHAEFICTEPLSKVIKVRLRVQKEAMDGAILEEAYTVVYPLAVRLCEACSHVQANPDQLVAAVQLRQHVSHRRTFFYLEQLIVMGFDDCRAIRIKQMAQGIDFFFSRRSYAVKFVDFVSRSAPIRSRNDKQLVSHDTTSNNCSYMYTFSFEISPICRGDLICLPPEVSVSLGNFGPLVICTDVCKSLDLLDPFTLRDCSLYAEEYWKASFQPLLTSSQLVEYIVLDVKIVSEVVEGSKYCLADVQVAHVSDFGKNDIMFNVRTHIGHRLKTGDYALGYDLYSANTNGLKLDQYRGFNLPGVVLVKKIYNRNPRKMRDEKITSLYEQFLRDLEENPNSRFNIPIFRDKICQASEMASMTKGKELPKIPLEELADLRLNDGMDEDDGDAMSIDKKTKKNLSFDFPFEYVVCSIFCFMVKLRLQKLLFLVVERLHMVFRMLAFGFVTHLVTFKILITIFVLI